jgi:hypothetical protein
MEPWEVASLISVTGKAVRTAKIRYRQTTRIIRVYVEPKPKSKRGYRLYGLRNRQKVRLAPSLNVHPKNFSDWKPAVYPSQA